MWHIQYLGNSGEEGAWQNLIPLQVFSSGPLHCWDLSHSSIVNYQEEHVDVERFFVISPKACLMGSQFEYAAD